jgi:hypothetical protein
MSAFRPALDRRPSSIAYAPLPAKEDADDYSVLQYIAECSFRCVWSVWPDGSQRNPNRGSVAWEITKPVKLMLGVKEGVHLREVL